MTQENIKEIPLEERRPMYNVMADIIKKSYQSIQESFTFIDSDIGKEINDIPLRFSTYESGPLAHADYINNEIMVHLKNYSEVQLELVLIHELAHFVCRKYLHIKQRPHCLEFAIITYCLQHHFDDTRTNYFKAYDIHQDTAYAFISINPCQFDTFIRNISFSSFSELCTKASKLAVKIRKKCTLYDLND